VHDPKEAGRATAAIAFAGSLLGLGAYLYLLGGMVMWLRFTGAQLPTDDAMRALDAKRLLAVGIKALLFEMLLLGVLLLLARVAWIVAKGTESNVGEKQKHWEAWVLVLQGVIVGVLVGGVSALLLPGTSWWPRAMGVVLGAAWVILVLPGIEKIDKVEGRVQGARQSDAKTAGRGDEGGIKRLPVRVAAAGIAWRSARWWVKTFLTIVAAGIAIWCLAAPAGIGVLVLLVFLHLSNRLDQLPSVRNPSEMVGAVLILGAGLSIIVATYLATPPVGFDRTAVILTGGHTVEGGYLGQSGEGVFLATCTPTRADPRVSRPSHLRVLSPDRIRRVVVGGPRYVLDNGKNPSLLELVLHGFDSDPNFTQSWDTASLDVRAKRLVCGLQQTFKLERPIRHERWVSEQVHVYGAGTLTLSGKGLEKSTETLKRSGRARLPMMLDPATRRADKCSEPIEATAEVSFDLDDGHQTETSVTVKLPVRSSVPFARKYLCPRQRRDRPRSHPSTLGVAHTINAR
jgi:hypothetical protein